MSGQNIIIQKYSISNLVELQKEKQWISRNEYFMCILLLDPLKYPFSCMTDNSN